MREMQREFLMLKLYYNWRSTSSRRVRIALHEKGLEWEGVHLNTSYKHENYEPWYTAMNPYGVVPTLDHDGHIVSESNVINEYLEDTFPDMPLRPADAHERARMRIWLIRSENEAHDAINPISEVKRRVRREAMSKDDYLAHIRACPHPGRRALKEGRVINGISDSVIEVSHQRLAWLMDRIEQELAEGPWLAGSTYSLADIAMAPFIERFIANDIPEVADMATRLPRAHDWWARLEARPAYQHVMAMTNPDATDPFGEVAI
jgi:glutathione S-transferase